MSLSSSSIANRPFSMTLFAVAISRLLRLEFTNSATSAARITRPMAIEIINSTRPKPCWFPSRDQVALDALAAKFMFISRAAE